MRLRILTVLPLALALTLTGCGSDDKDDTVASANGGAKQGGAEQGGEQLSPEERGVKFAQCMREHGVDMEDPKPGGGIRIQSKGDKGAMDKAMEACRQYNPMDDRTGAPDPKMQEQAREFAACMRKNGVEKFPDPDPNQPGIRIDKNTVGDDPDLETAQQACEKVLQGGRK
ncbi:hypothetical protein [Actinomadura citrea]|uniref:Uncharacterized protein n=1 Tax=Actinomadura citrea TaxID=46158 RepID=A0A7Y9KDM7_9ACTN|nr:hypothetical protein [Actinomadura citrea]NYE11769.1 hypothetical protein [Actinomadura citrea]GGT91498.1 hypothetical protein GCM10010177_58500 [Actinomadura citrea]